MISRTGEVNCGIAFKISFALQCFRKLSIRLPLQVDRESLYATNELDAEQTNRVFVCEESSSVSVRTR